MTILLPDVSEFQTGGSAPDWPGIKTKNGGAAIIRVAYGNAHLDHMFAGNYTALKKNGYRFIGLYHYLVADQDVSSQANAFCNWVGPRSAVAPGTVFILDLEEGNGDQSNRALMWHNIVDNFYGLSALPLNQRSWLYSYTSFVATHNLGGIFASNRRTWIAAYQSTPPSLGHTLWQSTDGVSGSNIVDWPGCGRTDTSQHDGNLDTLAAMGWQGSMPPTPTPPPPVTPMEEAMLIPADRKTHAISFANGQYTFIAFFCDNTAEGKPTQQLRVVPWSPDAGFAATNISVDSTHEKVTVALPAHCAGISIQRPGQDPDATLWCPVAYNLG